MPSSDTAQAALLLVNRLTPVDAEPLRASEYWALLERVPDPAELLGLTLDEVEERFGDRALAERVVVLLAASVAFAMEQQRLEESGIAVLSTFDERFPRRLVDRLGTGCPAFLLAAGPLDWVADGGLGIVGSRDVSEEGSEVAADTARTAARLHQAVVSGLARGVDQIAMAAALDSGGRVTGVPTEGVRRVARNSDIRRWVHAGSLCLLSPYGPDSGFTTGNAMGRNRLIYALADTTLVVASDDGKGGTWGGATEALRRRYCTVAVWLGPGAGPGNEALVRKGATGVDRLDTLFDLPEPSPPPQQLGLSLDASREPPEEPATAALRMQHLGVEPPLDVAASPGTPPLNQQTTATDLDVPAVQPENDRAGASAEPTETCWCGCGKPAPPGEFFAPRHELVAIRSVIRARYGNTPGFLLAHGFGPAAAEHTGRDDAGGPATRRSKDDH